MRMLRYYELQNLFTYSLQLEKTAITFAAS